MRLLIRLKLINELKLVIPPLQFIHCNLGQPKAVSLKISLIVCNLYLKLAKTACECINVTQWWSVTKYNYFVTVLKYIFQVSVLYWSSFILSNFYFYFTTFQSIRSYFLLHYIS